MEYELPNFIGLFEAKFITKFKNNLQIVSYFRKIIILLNNALFIDASTCIGGLWSFLSKNA